MKVGIIFGGRSCEHDISIITGVMTVNAASVKHEAVPIYIDGGGQWYTGKNFNAIETFASGRYKKKKVHMRPASRGLYTESGRLVSKLDAVIICNHGLNGEDGTVSGLLELSGIPYAGSGVLASAVGMDKIIQKKLYREAGIPVTPFIELEKTDLEDKFFDLVAQINDRLKFPLMIKPANLGSSIGIGRAADYKELFLRVDEGFEWDNRLIIEEALTDFIEVNCAVLGYGSKLLVSQIEQPLTNGFLSYNDKYGGGSHGEKECASKGVTGRYLPAHVSPEMAESVREAAKKVFRLIGCAGVARVDFLIKDDNLYVNEINTVPGSLSSYLFAFDGIDFPMLIDKLLDISFAVKRSKERLKYTYDSNVLKSGSSRKLP